MVSRLPADPTALGRLTGVGAADITWDYFDMAAVNLNFGPGTSTVNVLATADANGPLSTTNIFNSGPATINLGNAGSLADFRAQLNLENEAGSDTVNINDQADAAARTATFNTVTRAGDSSLGALTGVAPAQITWDYRDTASVTFNGSNLNNIYVIEASDVPLTINSGTGTNIFRVSPVAHVLANITGALTINGSGTDTLEFFDQNNPLNETYTFDAIPSSLSLDTVPGFSANWTGISAAYLQTNGASTVMDASGTVIVDGTPP
jgi:hypothetical protein